MRRMPARRHDEGPGDQRARERSLRGGTMPTDTGPSDAQIALTQAQERLRTVLDLSTDWYWEQDEQYRFTVIDGAALRLTGLDAGTYQGRCRWDHGATPVGDGGSWEPHRRLLDARQPFHHFMYQRTDEHGKRHYVRTSGVPVFDANGVFRGYRGIARDVTADVEAANVLKENEARFRALAEASVDWIWEQDENLCMSYVSKEAYSKARYTAGSILGKKRWELPGAVPLSGSWDEHRACLESHQAFRDYEYKRVRQDGSIENYISISGSPVFADDGTFKGYRGVGRDITDQKRTEERIRHLASHDTLTGLANRAMFGELLGMALQQAKRYQRRFAVLFIDLDGFKLINDTLGHEAGDALLKEVAERLTRNVRASDIVARLGGDEFVVLMQEVQSTRSVAAVARKLLDAVFKPVQLAAGACQVAASIGIALYPGDGEDEQTLLKHADAAMYRAKVLGKRNFQFHAQPNG
jgi:diguanylate cyclase (GGDEF)-like protein/PAS domain S-box-containing protein